MELKVKKMRDNAIIPTRGSDEAAGIDLYVCTDEPISILPGRCSIFTSGIACDFPEGYFGAVQVRSSVGIKRNLALMNGLGIIDNDYKGEIMIGLYNYGVKTQVINPGERIAQMVLLPYVKYDITETNTLEETDRGTNGIGSTGI